MPGNPFDDPMMSMMYQDALHSLYAGAIMPWERDLLAIAPLPTDIVDPFASQDVDPRQIMGFAYNSLVTWIEEARKANYFSKRFTDLSRLVLKGVMTMGRGLVTLHNRGEDLSQAPMQIGDLISVASYHFRKSYLGVIQTAKSHPEISERLLINQLNWTNMLLRLYKTKDNLNKKSEIRNKKLDILENEEGKSKHSELPDGKAGNSEYILHNSTLDEGRALPDVAALFAPAGLSAPRALTSLDKSKGTAGSRKGVLSAHRSTDDSEKSAAPESQSRDREDKFEQEKPGTQRRHEKTENNRPEPEIPDTTETPEDNEKENKPEESKNTDVPNNITEENATETGNPEIPETSVNNTEAETPEKDAPDQPEVPEEETGNRDSKEAAPDFSEIPNEQHEEIASPTERPAPEETAETFSGQDPSPEHPDSDQSLEKQIHETELSKHDPPHHLPEERDLPHCLQIMKSVITRSEQSGDGSLTFTFDEVRYLATDPVFARIDPGTAAEMRKMLRQIDSG